MHAPYCLGVSPRMKAVRLASCPFGSWTHLLHCSWERRADTDLHLAHFKRHREGAGDRKADLAMNARRRKAGQKVLQTQGPPPKFGVDHSNPVTKLMAKVKPDAWDLVV